MKSKWLKSSSDYYKRYANSNLHIPCSSASAVVTGYNAFLHFYDKGLVIEHKTH